MRWFTLPLTSPFSKRPPLFVRHRRALALSACLLLGVGQAQASEWFVSTTGNDSTGTGTLQNPFRTIKRVLSTTNGVAVAGDIITVRGPAGNNTYAECDVRLRVKLTLRSYAGERAHIQCPLTTPDSVVVQIDPRASGSRLSNLEISGSQYYGVMMQTNWYQGGPASDTGASDVVLEDLLIHHTGRDGIKITPKSNNITIRRSEIHTTGAGYAAGTPLDNKNAEGIDNVNGSGMVVEDNYIHDTATTGVYFKGGAMNVVVQRNRIENVGVAGILVGFDTSVEFFDLQANPNYYEAIGGVVRNNVIQGTNYAGIGLYASKDVVVANNTIIDPSKIGHAALYFGVTFQDWDPNAKRPPNLNPKLRNNLVIMGTGRCIDIRYSTELGGLAGLAGAVGTDYNGFHNAGCTFRDGRPGSAISGGGTLAQWRSAMNADANSKQASFVVDATGHLPAGSPAVDAGVTLPEVTDDIDKQLRGTNYDMGADERPSVISTPIRANGSQPLIPPHNPTATGAGALMPATLAATIRTPEISTVSVPGARTGTIEPAQVRLTPPVVRAWRAWWAWMERMRLQRAQVGALQR